MLSDKTIILASQSPRRREMFMKRGLALVIRPQDVDESLPAGISPRDAVLYLSLKKALSAEQEVLSDPSLDPDSCVIISADTVVSSKGEIMGKPETMEEAWHMIDSIRGTSHEVLSGVSLILPGRAAKRSFCDLTKVWVRDLSDEEVLAYVSTREPYDKAGAYAIQGTFGQFITHIEGNSIIF